MATERSILSPGRNCERIARASRVAWLVDGERYFGALATAIERAQHSVLMLGWDFHSRVRLRRNGEDEELIALLERVVRGRRSLHVHMLGWDFAMIYALEREFLPLARLQQRTHRRLHFRLDDRHPLGASHHQKLVVVDDAVAFCGGLDVTACRWDSREHRHADPRRSDPGFESYEPFHDAQMLVDGEAAQALGALARERWHRATGRHLKTRKPKNDPWPPDVEPNLRDVGVAIARTQPAYRDVIEVRHVEALYVDAIERAHHAIYIENQYFTSSAIGDALANRLSSDDAPDVVIVLPRTLSGWLEQKTMGALMSRMVARLREADRTGRLRVYVPRLPGGDRLTVHAKLMVVDDRLVRVGSANLSNRSMGLDTECDVAVEADGDAATAAAIEGLRDDLLAEHLGVEPDLVRRAVREHGSLADGVDALCRGDRRLDPFEVEIDDFDEELLRGRGLFDPEQPIDLDELRERIVERNVDLEIPDSEPRVLPSVILAGAIPIALIAIWQLLPVAEWVTPKSISAAAAALEQDAAGRLLALVLFVAASLALVPVVSLIVATALVFGFVEGALLALVGSVASAAVGYGLGRVLWRDLIRRLAGRRVAKLNESLARRGLVATVLVRIVPVAPFAIVNLVAGASRVSLRDFVAGTLLGMAPGTLALAFFGERAAAWMRDPSAGSTAGVVAGAVFVVGGLALVRRILARTRADAGNSR